MPATRGRRRPRRRRVADGKLHLPAGTFAQSRELRHHLQADRVRERVEHVRQANLAAGVGAAVDVWPQFVYITLVGVVVAVLTWNSAVGLIGPQNAALFGNPIPITTFAVEIGRGYRPNAVAGVGVGPTIGALAAASLLARRRSASRAAAFGSREQALPETA